MADDRLAGAAAAHLVAHPAARAAEADERLRVRLAAMQANVRYLHTQRSHLEGLARAARAAADAVKKVDDDMEAMIQRGGLRWFNRSDLRKEFDAGKLHKLYEALGGVASDRLRAVRKAAEAEERRVKALREAARTHFGFDL